MNNESIINFLDDLYNKGLINDSKSIRKSDKYLNITPDTGRFLGFLTQIRPAKKILEIGTSNGYSTTWLALSTDESVEITTIESNPNKIIEARDNFIKTNLSRKIKILEGDALQILSKINDTYDLVFIDADRKIYHAILEDIVKITSTKGIIVFDNAISHKEEIKDVFDYFCNKTNYRSYLAPIGKGEFVVFKP